MIDPETTHRISQLIETHLKMPKFQCELSLRLGSEVGEDAEDEDDEEDEAGEGTRTRAES